MASPSSASPSRAPKSPSISPPWPPGPPAPSPSPPSASKSDPKIPSASPGEFAPPAPRAPPSSARLARSRSLELRPPPEPPSPSPLPFPSLCRPGPAWVPMPPLPMWANSEKPPTPPLARLSLRACLRSPRLVYLGRSSWFVHEWKNGHFSVVRRTVMTLSGVRSRRPVVSSMKSRRSGWSMATSSSRSHTMVSSSARSPPDGTKVRFNDSTVQSIRSGPQKRSLSSCGSNASMPFSSWITSPSPSRSAPTWSSTPRPSHRSSTACR
mmetsp:Transcript_2645/g.5844  ORF Transcript_2645/g.5844 Transcript_2645/m.5844 type:complete len:267 (-) Transcript_2645:2870-3670(-)